MTMKETRTRNRRSVVMPRGDGGTLEEVTEYKWFGLRLVNRYVISRSEFHLVEGRRYFVLNGQPIPPDQWAPLPEIPSE